MGVQVQAGGQVRGGVTLGGDLAQVGVNSPAGWSAGILLLLLALIVVVVLSLR